MKTLDNLIESMNNTCVSNYYKPNITSNLAGRWMTPISSTGRPLFPAVTYPTVASPGVLSFTKSMDGAVQFFNKESASSIYLSGFNGRGDTDEFFDIIIEDKIVGYYGLSGTSTSEQPCDTGTLTRHTDGLGLCIRVEIVANLGATNAGITIKYRNQDNIEKITTTALLATAVAQRIIEVPLAAGDYGVLKIVSAQLSASTGTVGNFGVYIAKQIALHKNYSNAVGVDVGPFDNGLPEIDENAFLNLVFITNVTFINMGIDYTFRFVRY